jgi:hypothetical protein
LANEWLLAEHHEGKKNSMARDALGFPLCFQALVGPRLRSLSIHTLQWVSYCHEIFYGGIEPASRCYGRGEREGTLGFATPGQLLALPTRYPYGTYIWGEGGLAQRLFASASGLSPRCFSSEAFRGSLGPLQVLFGAPISYLCVIMSIIFSGVWK